MKNKLEKSEEPFMKVSDNGDVEVEVNGVPKKFNSLKMEDLEIKE